jgi:hypothetical protein
MRLAIVTVPVHCRSSLACAAHHRTPQPCTPLTFLHLLFITHNSTTRPAMDKTTKDLDTREGGEELGYRKTARFFGVAESTLRRRHQGKRGTRARASHAQQLLLPQQEEVLLKCTVARTERALPPTKAVVHSCCATISLRHCPLLNHGALCSCARYSAVSRPYLCQYISLFFIPAQDLLMKTPPLGSRGFILSLAQ